MGCIEPGVARIAAPGFLSVDRLKRFAVCRRPAEDKNGNSPALPTGDEELSQSSPQAPKTLGHYPGREKIHEPALFRDTHLLVYTRDASGLIKQLLARSGLRHSGVNGARTGFQVLNESFVTVTRKLDPELSEEKAWADRDDLFAWEPVG